MKFTKMQGCGNDYVYVNCFKEKVDNAPEISKLVSDRHFGIGSDGLILIKPSDKADFYMDMYNSDGTKSQMCGNGIRCVAKYVYDYGLTDKHNISIETGAGIKYLDLKIKENKVFEVTVDMGSPITKASQIPVISDSEEVIAKPVRVMDTEYSVTCVSMGNPHAIIFVDDTKSIDIEKIGPLFEYHNMFPERTNTEFIHVIDKNTIDMRVWERGSGETLACGTGACASVYACIWNGFTEDNVTVRLLGGELKIKYDRDKNTIFMTGPAATVFDGEINLNI
ncbi:diaminopimelate epimerase [Anaerocolumna sedimenticola]|uniref:Diaminopimelate epimerase n=1 Tax=Anaerocolumna sedimenticola TaxID=2696063 RepID=A0A6P1TLI4_9FIRM|nr:diaminopimelate epimerase [Anaerocolumna sedimenticola]QHQ61273.1 diaminopimelate epimerase [Anaerocolumna sedimenticola]